MNYPFETNTLICYSMPQLGSDLAQLVWFIRNGDPKYNFHKMDNGVRGYARTVWKYDVVDARVVRALYA